VVVGWPPGHIGRPAAWREAWWALTDNWPLGLPFLTVGLMLLAWQTFGRDPAANRSIKPEYEPPPGLIPAEAGALVDERAEPRDVVATIVDLAVRRYLHIERVTTAFDETDFMFKRLRPVTGDPDLKPLELFVLGRLFGADWALNLRLLSEIRRDYDNVFPPIRDAIYETMVADGLFPASPETVKKFWSAAGGLLVAAGFVLFGAGPPWLGRYARLLPAGIGASGVVVALLSRIMPRRTPRGVRTVVHVLGFEEFLERAERDRLARMPPDTLHRWLPWAIALGVTERWIISFEGLKVDEPAWYTGPGPFTLAGYERDLIRFHRDTQEAILTSRRASGGGGSGGSGFGGGGFSGGGRGGGGGGTF
jgi:uncharacterized membrane protein YgcG